jgi:hypothetical protein
MVVDLGAGDALSFAVFCKSMQDHVVDGLAYAVDVWEDDEQRENAGRIPLTTINNFLHTHFRGQSYLLKLTAEQALAHFADRSVDLLRIDLDRSEHSIAELLDAWEPKLKTGALLLIAGIGDRKDALAALAEPPLVFPGGTGLAVMMHEASAADDSPHPLLRAISRRTDTGDRALVHFYEHASLHHALRHQILGHADVLYRKRPTGSP